MGKKNQPNIYRMLLPSVLGIILCAVCLVGSSFAWFSVNRTAPAQTIQSANYQVSTTVVDAQGIPAGFDGQSYVLAPGSYTVTLTADGTATTGYCTVILGQQTLYTAQFAQSSICFTVHVSEQTKMDVKSCWGTSIHHENPDIKDGSVIGQLAAVCTCESLCAEGAVNDRCAVCMQDHSACAAVVCNCTAPCGEDAVDSACPVCAGDIAGCLGQVQPDGENPELTEPEATDPEVTAPEATTPQETEPEETQPEAVQPEVTQPEVTKPEVTQPEATQPEETQAEATESPVANED